MSRQKWEHPVSFIQRHLPSSVKLSRPPKDLPISQQSLQWPTESIKAYSRHFSAWSLPTNLIFPPIYLESALIYDFLCSVIIKIFIIILEHGIWGRLILCSQGMVTLIWLQNQLIYFDMRVVFLQTAASLPNASTTVFLQYLYDCLLFYNYRNVMRSFPHGNTSFGKPELISWPMVTHIWLKNKPLFPL